MADYISDEKILAAVRTKSVTTQGFHLAEVSIRISDPVKTIEFYTSVLGMKLLTWWNDHPTRTSNYVFTYVNEEDIPSRDDENAFNRWRLSRAGNIEMAYSWDGITHPTKYESGKLAPNDFGHFGIAVPNYKEAMERFKQLGCTIIPCKADKSLSYILDPDGYRIEIFTLKWGDGEE